MTDLCSSMLGEEERPEAKTTQPANEAAATRLPITMPASTAADKPVRGGGGEGGGGG
eukprot:CAMPEP_0195566686 /NCGR_PEP_ID=MMETSP0814-20130614/1210_1 /TAXON_ID=97485 /ORGANISM="Prymnesium parvum, Strain Texoma1" /LENGTH=56 /DNA_ID=CAMNT_0040701837 /DNA_START=374 /DNA_END=544 /DNA_ORIENTATION=+